MNNNNLRRIVNNLIKKFGEIGARDYISSGDYPLELKARAISMIREDFERKCASAMVINGDIYDFEISQKSGSQFNRNYAN